jgi:hypothetical protein
MFFKRIKEDLGVGNDEGFLADDTRIWSLEIALKVSPIFFETQATTSLPQ